MKTNIIIFVIILIHKFYCIQLFGVQQDIDESDQEDLVIQRRNSVNPVILVPGLGGSRLDFKSKSSSSSKYDTLWLALWDSAFHTSWIKNVSVIFNSSSNQFQSQPDLDVRPVDFGGVDGISIIAPALPIPSESGYYDKLVSSLKKAGYTVGQNLFGIPFDFRIMNPQQLVKSGVYEQVKRIVEKAYIMNGNKRVHFIGHSEGCSFVHNLLIDYINDTSWNDKYISSLNLVSPVFGGAVTALAFATGPKKWVVPWLSGDKTYEMVKNFAATVEIVTEKNMNKEEATSTIYQVSVKNLTWLFDSTGRQDQSTTLKYMQTYVNKPPKAPGIKVNLHYGFDSQSEQNELNNKDLDYWWMTEGKEINGEGDGTVNLQSLKEMEVGVKIGSYLD
ncbi:MAG: putative group XV phospholipase A2 [Streblomastix strix]|uniref:Putative group XV phospholipase A2 n=1 Tax=Streblomastix strix TaxID=222440 RepID=A0A5J4VL29_9EUKA|nr:MAG: putative group XV phospholipase A2 [Streblomastix strix]